jgi:hypothetical protein
MHWTYHVSEQHPRALEEVARPSGYEITKHQGSDPPSGRVLWYMFCDVITRLETHTKGAVS